MRIVRRSGMAVLCALGILAGGSAAQAQANKFSAGKYLPNDTELVATVNLQQILQSDVAKSNKFLIDLIKSKVNDSLEDKGLDKWLSKAGFDLFRDLSRVTLVPDSNGAANFSDALRLIILEGKFDADKIEEAALAAKKEAGGGLKIIMISGVKAFEISPQDEKSIYAGILNKKTMIICANKKDFEEAVARANGDKKPNFKSEGFSNAYKMLTGKESIAIVATSDIMSKFSENNPNAGNPQAKGALDQLKKMDAMSMAITIQKDIDFQVGVNAKDEKTAKDFAAASNFGLGMAKAKLKEQVENNAQLAPFLDVVNSIRATTEGTSLLIRGQISEEALGKLLANLPGIN